MTDYQRTLYYLTQAAAAYHVTDDEVLSRTRTADICNARHILYWLLRSEGLSYPKIGALLERDHTTILHGVERVDADPAMRSRAWGLRAA